MAQFNSFYDYGVIYQKTNSDEPLLTIIEYLNNAPIIQLTGECARRIGDLLKIGGENNHKDKLDRSDFVRKSNCHTMANHVSGYDNSIGKLRINGDGISNSEVDIFEEDNLILKGPFEQIHIDEAVLKFGFPLIGRIGLDYSKIEPKINENTELSNRVRVEYGNGTNMGAEHLYERIVYDFRKIIESKNGIKYKNDQANKFLDEQKTEINKIFVDILKGGVEHLSISHSFVVLGKDSKGNYVCFEQRGKGGRIYICKLSTILFAYEDSYDTYFAPVNYDVKKVF